MKFEFFRGEISIFSYFTDSGKLGEFANQREKEICIKKKKISLEYHCSRFD